jgi:hypothetical protein
VKLKFKKKKPPLSLLPVIFRFEQNFEQKKMLIVRKETQKNQKKVIYIYITKNHNL